MNVTSAIPNLLSNESCHVCGASGSRIHLFEVATRRVVTACDRCAANFEQVIGGAFKNIPRNSLRLNIPLSQWDVLGLDRSVAFIFYSTATAKLTAVFPTVNGPRETIVSRDLWKTLIAANPALETMRPDVQALLAIREGNQTLFFISPINVCYAIAGMVEKEFPGLLETNAMPEVHEFVSVPGTDVPQQPNYA